MTYANMTPELIATDAAVWVAKRDLETAQTTMMHALRADLDAAVAGFPDDAAEQASIAAVESARDELLRAYNALVAARTARHKVIRADIAAKARDLQPPPPTQFWYQPE